MQTKQTVEQILDQLPDDCSIDDMLCHLYVVRSVERALADADSGKTIPHQQVLEELHRKWLVGDAE